VALNGGTLLLTGASYAGDWTLGTGSSAMRSEKHSLIFSLSGVARIVRDVAGSA
jgi:hypothetical protein